MQQKPCRTAGRTALWPLDEFIAELPSSVHGAQRAPVLV